MDARQERGLVIATTSKIEQNKLGWKAPSQSGKKFPKRVLTKSLL